MKNHKKALRLKAFAGVFLFITVIFLTQFGMVADAKRPVADTQPPTAPQNLAAVTVGETSVALKWTASTDNKGVSSYLVYKNSVNIATVTGTAYTATGLTASTSYSFFVKAKDAAGNLSASGNVLTVTTANPAPPPPPPVTPSKIVIGYYASWSAYNGYTPLNIPAASLTHIHYAFAGIGTDLKIAMGDPQVDPANFTKLSQLKAANPGLKTLISIGGWDGSGRFSDAALTDASRTVFADSIVTFIKQYGFDGVDIDWEYPVSGGLSTNVRRPEDKTNFTLLLQKIRAKLDAQGTADGKQYLLSIAGGAGSYYIANTELNLIANYVDYAVIMAYDIHGTWDTYTDLNAPLYTPTETSPQYKLSDDSTVKAWLAKGFPASKTVLGVPFYGYVYTGVAGGGNGLYKTFTGGSSVSYDNVVANYLNAPGYVRYTHAVAKVPWLFNGSTFVSYDDQQSITEKANYVKANNLAGASVWELSQNKNGVLLGALYSSLK